MTQGITNVLFRCPTVWSKLITPHLARRKSAISYQSFTSMKYSSPLGCGCNFDFVRNISITSKMDNGQDVGTPLYAVEEISSGIASTPQSVNILEYIDAVQESGKVAVLFSDSLPVLWTVDMLCILKDLPGMSWISVIICGTLVIRTSVGLTVSIIQQKSVARLEGLKPDLEKLGEILKMETAMAIKKFNWDEKTARTQFTKSYKKHWRRMVEDNNCHPMRNLALSLLQLPFWIFFSSALRNIVYALPLPRTPGMTDRWIQIHNEGTPWVQSLVLPDPLVFPGIFLVANLLNIEFSRRQRLQTVPETKLQKIFPWVLRGGIILITCFATQVPSAVSMYWATSSSLAFAQNVFLASQTGKRVFKIPTVNVQQSSGTITTSNKSLRYKN